MQLAFILLALCAAQDERPLHPDLLDCNERWGRALEEYGACALAMVLVEGDEIVHLATLGRRDPEGDLPVTPDTVFYIASVTKPFVAFALTERLFVPAGMTRTSGYASWMYAQDDVALPAVWSDTANKVVRAPLRKSDRTMHAAGGLGTSILDLSRWLRLQLGGGHLGQERLLSEEALRAMFALQTRAPESDEFGQVEGFGLGWQRGAYRGHLELRHGGGYVGYASYVCFLPELGLGLAIVASGDSGASALCRLGSSDVHERLLADDEVRDLLAPLGERQRSERERSARAVPAPTPQQLTLDPLRYAGAYSSEFFGTLRLELVQGQLRAHLGELALELSTPEPDVFSASSPAGPDVRGRFELAGDRVVALELEFMGAKGVRFSP